MYRLWLAILAVGFGSAIAYAQIINPSGGGGTPGGVSPQLQYNTGSTFGGISGVTSDSANVGFATSSQLILYGLSVGDCLKVGANNQVADFGAGCGGAGSPGGSNTQIQFNTAGSFGGVGGATSNGSNIAFTTNSLVINGQAISKVSGTTGTLATVTGTLSGNCVQSDANGNLIDSGTVACGGLTSTTSSTNIAAGSNITTSGSTANVTVNVVATPSFTTIIASGNLTAGSGQFSGAVSGTTAVFQTITDTGFTAANQCVQATGGVLAGTGVACATQVTTPSIAAGINISTTGTASNITVSVSPAGSSTQLQYNNSSALGGVSGATSNGTNVSFTTNNLVINGQAISKVSGTTGTLASITGTLGSGHCLQLDAVGNLIDSGNATCGGITASSTNIGAGTNITTSGSTANVTVNVVATPSFTTVIATGNLTAGSAQFSGFLTAGGASLSGLTIATETLSSNLTGTTANFSSNLTANIAQFPGFLSAGGASLSGLTIATATHSGNLTGTTTVSVVGWLTGPGANFQTATIAGALVGSTANLSGNLTGTTAQFSGLVTGTTGTFQTHTGATLNLTSNLTGTTAQFSGAITGTTATFQTVTAQSFTTVAQGFVPLPTAGSGSAFLRGDAVFATPDTLALANTTTTTPRGWVNWVGQGRTTADVTSFTTTGFLNLITINNLVAGRTYKITAEVPITAASAATGGIALKLGGGITTTNIIYDGWIVDSGFNGIKGNTQATALTTAVANATLSGTTGHLSLSGVVTVLAGGSLVLQAAGFTTAAITSTVTVKRGTTFVVEDIP